MRIPCKFTVKAKTPLPIPRKFTVKTTMGHRAPEHLSSEIACFTPFRHFIREVSAFSRAHFTRKKTTQMERYLFGPRPPIFGPKRREETTPTHFSECRGAEGVQEECWLVVCLFGLAGWRFWLADVLACRGSGLLVIGIMVSITVYYLLLPFLLPVINLY